MWLYPIVVFLVVVGIAGGIFAGGIFTIVLVPIAAMVLVGGLGYGAFARTVVQREDATKQPLPHREPAGQAAGETSPEQLADARRVSQ